MSTTVNKRQQVRNERTLQDLIKTVPGNDRCADCAAKIPGWASWSLGIFLCMRCAALHRKLGTHISKVKSLSMDSWSNEQVENMKRTGNTTSNQLYNPRNTKAAMPMDADEVDGVMERFIRQKYEQKMFNDSHTSHSGSRHNTGSTSSNETPPPLPPKPSKRFHFPSLRSSSSTFPRSDRFSPPVSPGVASFAREPSPPSRDKKHNKFLGVGQIGSNRDENLERKMMQLRDMGFTDEKRNLKVLKGLNGNIDRSVETLIRLGEGAKSPLPTHSPPLGPPDGSTNGITVEKARGPPTPNKVNNNPFDQLDVQNKSLPLLPDEPMSPASRNFSPSNPFHPFHPSNPQQPVQQPQQTLDQSLQALQLDPPPSLQSPQLFPNSTGGYGNGNVQQPQTNPFLQTYTPPPIPQAQYNQFNAVNTYNQQQHIQPQSTGQLPNPFLRQSRSQAFNPNNTSDNHGSGTPFGMQQYHAQPRQNTVGYLPQSQGQQSGYNPFQHQQAAQQSQPQNSAFNQLPQLATQQTQQNPPFGQLQQLNSPFGQQQSSTQQHSSFAQQQNSPFGQASPFSQQQTSSPFGQPQSSPFIPQQQQQQHLFSQTAASDPLPQAQFQPPASAPPQQQQLFQPPSSQPQQLQHTSTFPIRQDKNSILALYNYPQLAPPRPEFATGGGMQTPRDPSNGHGPKRSVTMPIQTLSAGSATATMNPFAGMTSPANNMAPNGMNGTASAVPKNVYQHASNESVDFGGGMMMNGRHSPDAFAGLSARMR
ncbi:ArfGap-domain-containing protein [Tothia fuscella]|uniref:ArfGap-domain-containing protein n=1 Tax=Tothia fuscella TaxID=1048955 RepID=A0A9P4NXI6_9PEZI|nr:ArfGap-domain-containing protein [Tothia fuscella]